MFVWGKRFVVMLGSISLLLLIVLLTIVQVLDSQWAKSHAASYLSDVLDREVHFAGSIDLNPGLISSLTVTSVIVRNPKSFREKDFLKVDSVFVAVSLLDSLFSGLRLEKLALDGVHLHLGRDEQGMPNWHFGDSEGGDERAESERLLKLPRVDRVSISAVSLLSDLEAERRTVSFGDIEIHNFNGDKSSVVDMSLELDGLPVSIKGELSSLNQFLAGETMTVAAAVIHSDSHNIDVRGAFSLVGSSEIEVRFSGDDVTRLNPLLRLELPDYGQYSWDSRLSHNWDRNSLSIENWQCSLGKYRAKGRSEIVLLDKGFKGTVNLFVDEQQLNLEIGSANFEQLDARVSVKGQKLTDLESLFQRALPAFDSYEVAASLTVDIPELKKVSFSELSLKVDGNDVSGAGEFQRSPAQLKASLQSDVFDLAILNKIGAKGNDSGGKESEVARSPFELFELLDAEVDWHFDDLKSFPGVELLDATVPFRLKKGVLRVPDFSASIFEGSFSANVELSKDAVALKLKGEQFKANSIAVLADGTPVLTGDFDLDVDLISKGDSAEKIIAALNGQIHLRSENAHINSGTLETVSAGLANILDPLLGKDREAQSECALIDYVVTNGVAKSGDQIIKIGDVFFFAEGKADFRENLLTYNFNVNSTNPTFASLIPPFRAFGPIDNPSFAPSVSGTVASISDSAEGVAESAMAMMKGASSIFLPLAERDLSGLEVCREALRIERSRVSSQIGDLIE